ncbi:MAG TPA: ThuA domain-containing protein [Polyangia bacterium]|jgi:type 1 glutamine amidotransferase
MIRARNVLALSCLVVIGVGCNSRESPSMVGSSGAGCGGASASDDFRVLLFSRTAAYRHDAIPAATAALMGLGCDNGYVADSTEDPTRFTMAGLAPYQVVVFLMTTGDVLDDTQQGAFEAWIAAGGAYVGIHSAADTEYDWPFYGALVGAYFADHPAVQPATVDVEVANHPATMGLTAAWPHTDEWYNFRTNPRPNVTVLATVDESTYSGGTMGADHPIVWWHDDQGGRAFYTAMGHTQDSYADPKFRQHLVGALRWAAGRDP